MSFMTSVSSSSPVNDTQQLDTQLYTMIELEATRYRAFFAKLAETSHSLLPHDQVVTFYRKSSLSIEQIELLYTQIKVLYLSPDVNFMNETEFILGMHLIVCMTKRHLNKLPATFPTYLFPTLNLPAGKISVPTQVSPKRLVLSNCVASDDASASSNETLLMSLVTTTSLQDFVTTELYNRQSERQKLSKVDTIESRTLEMVYLSMERLGNQVTKLGYSMPSLTRKVDGLNDWRQILEKHVSTIRNEIHGMQIIGTHKINPSLVSDVAQDSGEILDVISALTQELVALQHRTAQLVTKKADMVGRLVAVMAGGSAFATTAVAESLVHQPSNVVYEESKNPVFALSKGALTVGELAMSSAMTTLPKSSDPTSVQSHNSASSGGWGTFGAATSQDSPPPPPFGANIANPPASSDPFGFSSLPAAPDAAAKVTGTQESVSTPAPVNDFSWGAFQ